VRTTLYSITVNKKGPIDAGPRIMQLPFSSPASQAEPPQLRPAPPRPPFPVSQFASSACPVPSGRRCKTLLRFGAITLLLFSRLRETPSNCLRLRLTQVSAGRMIVSLRRPRHALVLLQVNFTAQRAAGPSSHPVCS
jgi:hypothetical protein